MIPVDIDVWLAAERFGENIKVIPYVRTAEEMSVHYDIKLVRQGTSISQRGTVHTSPKQPGEMGHMTVNANHSHGGCRINIVLTNNGQNLGQYEFKCPS